jgi:hypothetical protein
MNGVRKRPLNPGGPSRNEFINIPVALQSPSTAPPNLPCLYLKRSPCRELHVLRARRRLSAIIICALFAQHSIGAANASIRNACVSRDLDALRAIAHRLRDCLHDRYSATWHEA